MQPPPLNIVTGAFGYTGNYIAQRLLALGERVKTITGHPDRPNQTHLLSAEPRVTKSPAPMLCL